MGNTEEAFLFYRKVFGGEFLGLMRFGDVANLPGKEKFSNSDLHRIMHIALPIGQNLLMATDLLESVGQELQLGNNFSLSVETESRAEADRLFMELSRDGVGITPMQDMFWGDYWGMLKDPFGIQWMITFHKP
jgi:PhnB protein